MYEKVVTLETRDQVIAEEAAKGNRVIQIIAHAPLDDNGNPTDNRVIFDAVE